MEKTKKEMKATQSHQISILITFEDKVSSISAVYKSKGESQEEAYKNARCEALALHEYFKKKNPTYVRITDLLNHKEVLSKKL